MSQISSTLRPLSMGELLDRAIRLYRQNFLKFIGVIAVMQVPVALLTLLVALFTANDAVEALPSPLEIAGSDNPFELIGFDYYVGVAGNMLVSIADLVLVTGVASAALARMVADSYLGTSLDTIGAYRAIGKRWGPLLRALLLYAGILILLVAWVIVPCAGWFTGPGMMIVLTVMVLPLIAPVVVMENFGARKSIRRAWELVRGRFWWVFGFIILLFVFNWAVVGGPAVLTVYLVNFVLPKNIITNPDTLYNIQVSIESLVSLMFQLLYLPLQLTCLTLLYFDLRVRSEGLDLMLADDDETSEDVPLRDLIAETTTVPSTPLLSGREVANFGILTFGLLAIYLGLVIGAMGIFGLFTLGGNF